MTRTPLMVPVMQCVMHLTMEQNLVAVSTELCGSTFLSPSPRPHLMVDDTGHSPEVDDGLGGLESAVQDPADLALQSPEGRLDAEDALLAVQGKLEVCGALGLILYPQALLHAPPEVDPTEVHAAALQGDSRTWA